MVGNTDSAMFPKELLPYTTRRDFGKGGMKINFLVNYSWEWDLGLKNGMIGPKLGTADVSRVDLVIRWGGRRRLSGFLPVQSVYSDFYVVDDYWPDFSPRHVEEAISWYSRQDAVSYTHLDVYKRQPFIFLELWFNTFRYCGLLILSCSLTTQQECIAATFI